MTADFRHYWPGSQTRLLMKAAFHPDHETANQAWRVWQENCDFDKTLWGDFRVASIAYRRLGGLRAGGSLEPRLRGLRRYIWSAGQMRIDAARPLLQKLADVNVTFMLIKGSVLLARASQAMSERFITDLDVLVEHASWEKAVDISLQEGWSIETKLTRDTAVHRMRQTHHALSLKRGPHGAIDLHQFSLLLNRQLGADVMLWRRAGQGTLNGIPVRLPHPSDHLAIVFVHCFLFAPSISYDWVADALATISGPDFDWHLFADIVLDRELAVSAATALTYLAEELECPIPVGVLDRVVRGVREPFITEFVTSHRNVTKNESEWRAIYQAECIRSRRFVTRVPEADKAADRKNSVEAALSDLIAGQAVVLPIPSGVGSKDSVQIRLELEFSSLANGAGRALGDCLQRMLRVVLPLHRTFALVVLQCFDGIPLEIARWYIWSDQGKTQTMLGEIDGALIVGRGIDELRLTVTPEESQAPQAVTVSGSYQARVLRATYNEAPFGQPMPAVGSALSARATARLKQRRTRRDQRRARRRCWATKLNMLASLPQYYINARRRDPRGLFRLFDPGAWLRAFREIRRALKEAG